MIALIGNKVFIFSALVLFLSSCVTYQVDAATYKWTDKNGQVNYTQSPPNNMIYSTLISATAVSQIMPNNPEAPAPVSSTAPQQDIDIIHEHNCQDAKNLLNSLEEAGDKQVAILDNEGKQKYLTSNERGAYTLKAKEDIKKYCHS